VVGFVLPGPGVPALVAGGLILWPEGFGKVDGWLRRRFPTVHRKGMAQIERFLSDLERRYPGSTGGAEGGGSSRLHGRVPEPDPYGEDRDDRGDRSAPDGAAPFTPGRR